MTVGRIFTKIYIFISLSWVFSKTGKTRVSHRVKMMTRWPGRDRWRKWPGDPVTSGVLLKMEVGIHKGAWQRYPAYLWSLRWVYAVKKHGGWYTPYTRVYRQNTPLPVTQFRVWCGARCRAGSRRRRWLTYEAGVNGSGKEPLKLLNESQWW